MDNWGRAWPEGTWLGNNIFYTEDWARYDYGQARRTRFETNLYWGEHRNAPADPRAVWADPLFVELYISHPGVHRLFGPRLREGSPAINRGVVIPDNGGRDFFGFPLPKDRPPSIGPFE